MYISPNFTDNDWNKLDLTCSKLADNKEDWLKAINVLKNRLFSRYIEPVDTLIEMEKMVNPKDRRYGFTTLAIDLLLMETLQAFKEGLPDTNRKSSRTFKNYLKESPRFSIYFTTEPERHSFYTDFRCGILHQAEVQSSALVWSVGDLYDRTSSPNTVNRIFLHKELKKDLEDYLDLLKVDTSVELRNAFKIKMDALVARGGQA